MIYADLKRLIQHATTTMLPERKVVIYMCVLHCICFIGTVRLDISHVGRAWNPDVLPFSTGFNYYEKKTGVFAALHKTQF